MDTEKSQVVGKIYDLPGFLCSVEW